MTEVSGPIEVAEWLAVLVTGPLGGCAGCRLGTVWRHPTHGPVHPTCVEVAMAVLGDERVVPLSPRAGRRGAYSRQGVC